MSIAMQRFCTHFLNIAYLNFLGNHVSLTFKQKNYFFAYSCNNTLCFVFTCVVGNSVAKMYAHTYALFMLYEVSREYKNGTNAIFSIKKIIFMYIILLTKYILDFDLQYIRH